jgi:pimeloyl-ACP methyl ester carboxylesterase
MTAASTTRTKLREIELDTPRGRITALRNGRSDHPPLLALHGWLDNAASFIPLAPYLHEFDLVALDLPGHGTSAHRAPGYDYAFVDWIHDVLDAMDTLGWRRAHLLGHSMGAAIATLVAAAAPERVHKLAAIEALGPLSGEAAQAGKSLREAVAARRSASFRPRRIIPDIEAAVDARLAVGDMSREAARLIVARNLAPAMEGSGSGFIWRSDARLTMPTHLRITEAATRSIVRAVEAPTLLIAADPAPPYFTPELRDGRMSCLRDGHLLVVPGGHHLHMEQPEVIAPLLRAFFD